MSKFKIETKSAFERKSEGGSNPLAEIGAEIKSISAALEQKKGDDAETKAAVLELKTQLDTAVSKYEQVEEKLAQVELELKRFQAGKGEQEVKSVGSMFVKSDVYEAMNGRATGVPMAMSKKDISGLSTSAGALVRADRDPEVYRSVGGMRQLRIRDLIPSIPTTSSSVEIMRMKTVTNNAAPQGTTAGVGGGEWATKAQSDYVWELVTVPIATVAHWTPASRQVLSDAPMLQGIIDTELQYGLQLESDNQLLNGDGTGQNMTGILNTAGIGDVGEIASGTTGADIPPAMIAQIRKAKTQLQLNEYYNVNGVLLNPADWETLELAQATDGHYLLVSFAATADSAESIWRVPVVLTNAISQGEFLLGDWQLGAKIYDRESIEIRVSESHGDYFVKNGVAILAEERYTLAVNRPKAFCKGSFSVTGA